MLKSPVVGVMEEFLVSMQVPKKMVPRFFGGTAKLYTRLAKELGAIKKNIYQPTADDKIKELVHKNDPGSGLLQLLSTDALQAILIIKDKL